MTKPGGQSTKRHLPGHPEFQQVHDLSAMGVLAVDASGVVTYVNAVALAYMRLPKERVLGRSLFDLYQDTSPDQQNKNKLLGAEEITDQEFKRNTENAGDDSFALISTKIHRDEKGLEQTYVFLRDISVQKKKERLFSYLNKAAEELTKARDTKSALEQIARFIVPTFASWFIIDIINGDKFESLLLKHADQDRIEWARDYRKKYPPDPNGQNGQAYVLKTGKAGFVPVVTDEQIAATVLDPEQLKLVLQIGLKSVILAPMSNQHAITGVVSFISSRDDRYFDETDLEFAQNFASLVGLVLDNTRLNEAASKEIALRQQSEEQFRFLADVIPHKTWTATPDGRASYYNKGWYDYTGFNDFDSLRNNIWEVIHPDERAVAAVEYPKAIQAGYGWELEQRFRRHDGVYRWHLTRFAPHKDGDGNIMLWVGTSTDIHEQKESRLAIEAANNELSAANNELATANEELFASNEELSSLNEELASINEELTETQAQVRDMNAKKDEFIGLASHELKTPLTSIMGYLQILEKMMKEEQTQKYLVRTLNQAQRLTDLVNDLLDVSRIEAGKLKLAEVVFDMRKIVDEAIELIRHINPKYEIALESPVAECMVRADSQRIEQVIINLLTNAIKYSPGANKVIVRLSCNESEATVSVTDFGIGIPANKRSKIFSRFYRVEDANPAISGLGIGLYISNEIISRHNGKLWVDGNVGAGSTFYFSLPIIRA